MDQQKLSSVCNLEKSIINYNPDKMGDGNLSKCKYCLLNILQADFPLCVQLN